MDASIVILDEMVLQHEVTDGEVQTYATTKLGMSLPSDNEFLHIAREGVRAKLPKDWQPCQVPGEKDVFYFNLVSGESQWEHPCVAIYKKQYLDAKAKAQKQAIVNRMSAKSNQLKQRSKKQDAHTKSKPTTQTSSRLAKPLADITTPVNLTSSGSGGVKVAKVTTIAASVVEEATEVEIMTKPSTKRTRSRSKNQGRRRKEPEEAEIVVPLIQASERPMSSSGPCQSSSCTAKHRQEIVSLRQQHREEIAQVKKSHEGTIESVVANLRRLQSEVAANDKAHRCAKANFDKELKARRQAAAIMESENKTLQAEVKSLSALLEKKATEMAAEGAVATVAEEAVAKAKETEAQLRAELNSATERNAAVLEVLAQERKAAHKLKLARSKRRHEISLQKKNLANKDVRIEGLQRDVAEQKANVKAILVGMGLIEVAADVTAGRSDMLTAIEGKVAAHEAVEEKATMLKKQRDELEHEQSRLRNVVCELSEKLATTTAAVEEGTKNQEETSQLRQQLSDLQKQLMAYKEQGQQQEKLRAAIQEDCSAKDAQIKQLNSDVETLQKQNEGLKKWQVQYEKVEVLCTETEASLELAKEETSTALQQVAALEAVARRRQRQHTAKIESIQNQHQHDVSTLEAKLQDAKQHTATLLENESQRAEAALAEAVDQALCKQRDQLSEYLAKQTLLEQQVTQATAVEQKLKEEVEALQRNAQDMQETCKQSAAATTAAEERETLAIQKLQEMEIQLNAKTTRTTELGDELTAAHSKAESACQDVADARKEIDELVSASLRHVEEAKDARQQVLRAQQASATFQAEISELRTHHETNVTDLHATHAAALSDEATAISALESKHEEELGEKSVELATLRDEHKAIHAMLCGCRDAAEIRIQDLTDELSEALETGRHSQEVLIGVEQNLELEIQVRKRLQGNFLSESEARAALELKWTAAQKVCDTKRKNSTF